MRQQAMAGEKCLRCPDSMSTLSEGATSVKECVCLAGFQNTVTGCELCPRLTQSAVGGDCEVVIGVWIGVGIIVVLIVSSLIGTAIYRKYQRLLVARRIRHEERVIKAIETVSVPGYPVVVMSASNFIELGGLQLHESLRDSGKLKVLDSVQQVKTLQSQKGNLVFVSHQWLGWDHPDPNKDQYPVMVTAVQQLVNLKGWSLDNTFLWLDYISIPQIHRNMQSLAVGSLPVYAAVCNAFLIVAPAALHSDTGEPCGFKSHMNRAWCRAEQFAHLVGCGTDSMFFATDTQNIQQLTREEMRLSFFLFEASLTCCSRGHPGAIPCDKELMVDPLLGLYAQIVASPIDSESRRWVKELIEEEKDRIFPHTHKVEKPAGDEAASQLGSPTPSSRSSPAVRQSMRLTHKIRRTEVTNRELFGEMIGVVDCHLKRGDLSTQLMRAASKA